MVLLPYFLGEKTPLHDPHARGTLVGVGLHHGLPNVWRAALEAEMGLTPRRVLACDGGATSDLWLQITADVLEQPVQRLLNHPGSCLGAAFVAGMGVGALADWGAISRYVQPDRTFEPESGRSSIYREAYGLYRETYDRLSDLYPRLGHLPAS